MTPIFGRLKQLHDIKVNDKLSLHLRTFPPKISNKTNKYIEILVMQYDLSKCGSSQFIRTSKWGPLIRFIPKIGKSGRPQPLKIMRSEIAKGSNSSQQFWGNSSLLMIITTSSSKMSKIWASSSEDSER